MVNKYIFAFLLIGLTSFSIQAQTDKTSNYTFLEFGLGAGTHGSFSLDLNFITKSNFIFSTGVSGAFRNHDNLPENYVAPWAGFNDMDRFRSFSAQFGKVLKGKRNNRFRLMGGPSYTSLYRPINFTPNPNFVNDDGYTDSHDYDIGNTKHLSLSLMPSYDFFLRSGIGMSIKGHALFIPKYRVMANIMLSMSLGEVGPRVNKSRN